MQKYLSVTIASLIGGAHCYRSHIMKNMFSLVSTYTNWSSRSPPTPRMRKTRDSCMVSAAHPLVTRRSYRLFRFNSCRYLTKGVIIIGRPPLCGDTRYLRGASSWRTSLSSLRDRHADSSVVGCINQHQCLYSVPATEEEKRQWLGFIF